MLNPMRKLRTKKTSTDLFYVFFHSDQFDYKNPPLPKKIVGHRHGVLGPNPSALKSYRYLLGHDTSYRSRIEETMFKGLTEQDLTYLGLKLDVLEIYTVTFNEIETREFDLACGKFIDALKVFDGLSSSQRKSAMKKDPIYEIVYLTDVQKELFRAKGYMSKSIADDKYFKLIDTSILDPKKLSDKKLFDWHFKILDSLYKLRF